MRHLTIRLLAVAAVAVISMPASAQSPVQIRFNVQPAANDPVWQNFKGMTLEKEAECYYAPDTASLRTWNPARGSVFKGKTVLFNPGFASWDGTKQVFAPNTKDDGFNALFLVPAGANAQTKSIVCRARILANGQNVAANQNDITFGLISEIASKGPPTAIVKLDASKLAAKPAEPAVSIKNATFGPKNIAISNHGTLTIDKKDLPAWVCGDKGKSIDYQSAGCLVTLQLEIKRNSKQGELAGGLTSLSKTAAGKVWTKSVCGFQFKAGEDAKTCQANLIRVLSDADKLPKSWCSDVQLVYGWTGLPKSTENDFFLKICINNN